MLWRTKLVWENTEQELLVCVAINLIYEYRALIRPADWQHCEELPTFLCECERQLTCFDCCALFFWELMWWTGIKRKLQSGVKFHRAHRSKKTIIIILHFFLNDFPSFFWLSHMGTSSFWLQSWWKGMDRLLLCKRGKLSSHAVFVFTIGFIAPS